MSRMQDLQSANGIALNVAGLGVMQIIQNSAPTNGVIGYGKGCLYVNTAGANGSILYINQGSNGFGTNATATWLAIA